jgi:hypothetical protein
VQLSLPAKPALVACGLSPPLATPSILPRCAACPSPHPLPRPRRAAAGRTKCGDWATSVCVTRPAFQSRLRPWSLPRASSSCQVQLVANSVLVLSQWTDSPGGMRWLPCSVCLRVPFDGSSLTGSLLGSGQPFSCPARARSSLAPVCLTAGVVYPKDGPLNKETGRRCERFGPLTSFSLDLTDKKAVPVGGGGPPPPLSPASPPTRGGGGAPPPPPPASPVAACGL